MGSCFSSPEFCSDGYSQKSTTANVVLANGDLRRYPIPVTVSYVLEKESVPSSSFFVCNSDRLYYDDYIPALALEDELQAEQIYFILPIAKLQYRLTASYMAALAVKASVALQAPSTSNFNKCTVHRLINKKKKKPTRISPLLLLEEDMNQARQIESSTQTITAGDIRFMKSSGDKSAGVGVTRSISKRKLQRYSSRRAKMTVRSFRMKLTTIYEGSVLQRF